MTKRAAVRVLLTRPRCDAEQTARLLARRAIESVIAPLIEIDAIAGATVDLAGVQAVLVTSANGARALARATPARDRPVFAVGDASAAALAASGFSNVASAGGDVVGLAALVAGRVDPQAGALLHVTGSAVAGDLAGELAKLGYEIRAVPLYRAYTVETLPPAARNALEAGAINAVLFYSPRTAGHFAKLVTAAQLAPHCQSIAAVCLSRAVADALAGVAFAEVRIAATPDQNALLDELATVD